MAQKQAQIMVQHAQAAQKNADNAQIELTNRAAANAQAIRDEPGWKLTENIITLDTTLTNFNTWKKYLQTIAIQHLCVCKILQDPNPNKLGEINVTWKMLQHIQAAMHSNLKPLVYDDTSVVQTIKNSQIMASDQASSIHKLLVKSRTVDINTPDEYVETQLHVQTRIRELDSTGPNFQHRAYM